MRKIIVHTGYVPYSIVRKSKTLAPKDVPAQFIMLTPEINIVNNTNKLLNSMNDGDELEIATNNVITIYTIRAYVVKHTHEYDVEYRYYTHDDSRYIDESHYQLITQGERGDFINPPEGFFDTIDNLLNQMLGLDKITTKKQIAITLDDKRILNDVIDDDEKSYFLKDLAKYETECVLNEDWLTWTDHITKLEQIDFYKTLKTEQERFIYATALGQQYALERLLQPIEGLLKTYDLDCINTFFKNIEFYIESE